MTAQETQAVIGLASIFAVRMLGFFLILPVLSIYASRLEGYQPLWVGLAIGIYGLTQACLQIPFGMLSDRIGRKPVIVFGLLLFIAGSVVAAMAESFTMLIIGRALQGSGAVASAIIALTADLTRESKRTMAMAIIGMTIGASFVISMLLGSIISELLGVSGIFWVTAGLGVLGIGILYLLVPNPTKAPKPKKHIGRQFMAALKDVNLLRLDAGIFILHGILMAMFVVIPFSLSHHVGLEPSQFWKVYVPVMMLSAIFMFPMIMFAERRQQVKPVFLISIVILVISQIVLAQVHTTLYGIAAGLLLFFIGFNVLEAKLPSIVSKVISVESKGTAMGVYSTSQFLGAFVGGTFGGLIYKLWGITSVYIFIIGVLLCWLVIASTMAKQRYIGNTEARQG
jgi:MFS family permease